MRENIDFSLYLVTDQRHYMGAKFLWAIEEAVKGGVSVVQLREKKLNVSEFLLLANAVQEILRPRNIALIINDQVEVAKKCGAAGVHLGQKDLRIEDARAYLGQSSCIGLSVENIEQLPNALISSPDYLGVGPVFSTQTKEDAAPVLGTEKLAQILRVPKACPVVAIGGIDSLHLKKLIPWRKEGLKGVAVSSALMQASDPRLAAQELKNIWESADEN